MDKGGLHQREKLGPSGEKAGEGMQSDARRDAQFGASSEGHLDGVPTGISTS